LKINKISIYIPSGVFVPKLLESDNYTVTRSSAMAEGLHDALVSIEKKLTIDELP